MKGDGINEAALDAYVKRVVAMAPPLTDEQRTRLAELLRPVQIVVKTRHDGCGVMSNARKTHCPKKHEYSKENTYVDKTGRRHCRKCDADKTRERSRQRYGERSRLAREETSTVP